ncbi:MAG: translocation/assembly module TamB domain-containing protein [Pseudomonadales bacterium]
MKRHLVIVLGALLLLLALLASTVLFLAASEGGTRFLAAQAERFLPVRFQDVSGTLWDQVRVGRLELELEGQRVRVDRLAVALSMQPLLFDNRLELHRVAAAAVVVELLESADDGGPPPALALPFMPVDIELTELSVERLQIGSAAPLTVLASAAWNRDGVTVRTLSVASDVVDAVVSGQLGGGGNPRLTLEVQWALPGTEWDGEGSLSGRVAEFTLSHELRGPVTVSARGRGSLAEVTRPELDLDVEVGDLSVAEIAIAGIAGRVYGTPDNLIADARASVVLPEREPFSVTVAAYGPVMGPLTLREVRADALGGQQEAQGSLGWDPSLRLFLGGIVTDVDLTALRDDVSGRLSAGFQFGYQDELLEISLQALSGTFNDRPVSGELTARQRDGGWLVDPLRLAVGDNVLSGRLDLQGSRIDLAATVAAADLGTLGLGVDGDAAGSVAVRGTWPDLDGQADLDSALLVGFGARLERTRLVAMLDGGRLDGALTADRVARDELALAGVRATAAGALDDLGWTLAWTEGRAAGALRWTDDARTITVRSAEVQALDQTWQLDDPARISQTDAGIELAPTCVSGGGARACVASFRLAEGAIDTSGVLERMPLGLVQPWLPVPLQGDGYVEGEWQVAGAPDAWRGEVRLLARQLAYVPAEDDPVKLPDLEAFGAIGGDMLTVRLTATDEAFALAGGVRLAPISADGELVGTLSAAITDLSPLKVFDQRIETLGGSLNGLLTVSGTASAPRVEGRLRVADGSLGINDPDFALQAIDVDLRLDDAGTFDIAGSARQGEETLRLEGSGSGLFDDALAFRAAFTGRNLQAEHPDWEVRISPDINVTFANGRGRVRGRIEVPRAEVRLRTLPTSVPSRSDDVVVVGRDGAAPPPTTAFRTDVEIVLGNDVTLKALAITARLEGRLRARIDEAGRTNLSGTLDIAGGVLSAQGQTLTIESGSVVYNGPVTRPYIDLRAVRTIDTVTPSVKVGLHIRGDADNLTSSVFSEPAMSETRALSFLVLGRDIDQSTASSDSGQLMAAAINLGLSRSKGITGELMRMTGLDELSAMAEAQNSFAIVAGKRITDDLYVRYTYNTLSAVGAFLLRYSLTRRWHLEAQSGDNPAMDLLYSFEK